jgi:hypothetical protein
MGSRFAWVEFCAAIATIFKHYSMELGGGYDETTLGKTESQVSDGVIFETGLKLKEPMALRFVEK